jgi:hypothetical protein
LESVKLSKPHKCCEIALAEDALSLLALFIGGSGIAGWVMTYLQLREERRARIISRYRETILTPEFLDTLSVLEMTKNILRAQTEIKKGKQGTVIVAGQLIRASNKAEMDAKLAQAGVALEERFNKTMGKGFPIVKLFPKKIQDAFDSMFKSIDQAWASGDWSIAEKQYNAMYSEVRKMLGFEE